MPADPWSPASFGRALRADVAADCRRLWPAIAALAAAGLTMACSDAKPVSFYASHPAERDARIEQCVATVNQSEDCLNAKQASYDAAGIPAAHGRPLAARR